MKVGETLEQLFPRGTTGQPGSIAEAPTLPTDIFGAAAYLLEKSGAYHHLFPLEFENAQTNEIRDLDRFRELGKSWFAATVVLENNRTNPRALAQLSASLLKTRKKVQAAWTALCSAAAQPLMTPAGVRPAWWLDAARLFVFADEAAREVGYRAARNPERSLIDRFFDDIPTDRIEQNQVYEAIICKNPALTHRYADFEKTTFAASLNAHLACVMPKGRTPNVGCTMRALSHNLSLISNPSALELAWFVQDRLPPAQFESLNLLLVPFPYEISARCFRAKGVCRRDGARPWGWFEVDQHWLYPTFDIVGEITPLLKSSEMDAGPVHAIVLPELALDWPNYTALVEFVIGQWNPGRAEGEAIQFIVCGTAQNHHGAKGNFAYVTSFHQNAVNGHWEATTFGRRKHHRWKLTSAQLTEYAIGSVLDPEVDWWEHIHIQRRGMAVHVFRESASVAALICEDLARSDPCHEPLKSLGPNLVVALLMDGAQLPSRWSGRYATALADDPGSSVLTLSSLGLIDRSNKTGRHPVNRTVALWKDDTGRTVSLDLPRGAKAITLTLSTSRAEEFTLDGRQNSDAIALRYLCHQPVLTSESISP